MDKPKLYLLTYEELERFDHMITALMQAYWALVTHRAVDMPAAEIKRDLAPEEQRFYQLHFDFNDKLD